MELYGGQGDATRPSDVGRGILGRGQERHAASDRICRYQRELIDTRQSSSSPAPDAGLVVVRPEPEAGKTTIGLHRMAYLDYWTPRDSPPIG